MTSEHVRGPEMRSGLKILGLGAACAAACSLPVILPALGFAFLGIGAGTWAILALIFVGMIGGLIMQRKRAASAVCNVDGSCGCKE